uniref:DUF2207 domain-containing protein n=1 Tax=Mycolicibacterium sp. TaxID=2320850 RepID=UPI0028A606E5
MGSFGRKLAWLIPLALILIGLLWPGLLPSGDTEGTLRPDPVTITDLRADFSVDRDGSMQATETITALFPPGRHGIFRFWDVANAADPHVRQLPQIDEITLDGQPARYETLIRGRNRFVVAKIGDPYRTLASGVHVYRIRYRIAGVLDPGNTGAAKTFASTVGEVAPVGSAFYWQVVAPGWSNQIDRAEISVRLPGPVPGAQCSAGSGVGVPCSGLTVDGDTIRVSASNLAPATPVTVRAGVDVPTP